METTARPTTEQLHAQQTPAPQFSRRAFLRMAGVSSFALAAAACLPTGAPPSPQEPDAEIVQLVYQDWRTDWFPPMAQKALEQFHDQHPNVRVFYTPDPDNLEETMLAEMEAGTAPDVFQGCCAFFPIWAQRGHTLDLQPYVERDLDDATIADWSEAQYDALALHNGHRFGLPKYHGGLALYYNKDLFDQAEVAYPTAEWTHDDYLAAMRRLSGDRDGDGALDQWGSMVDISWERIQVHVNAWGGHLIDPDDPARCVMDQPEVLAAMEWIRARMWDDRVMASFLDVENRETRHAFIAKQIAMVEDGSWALKDILNGADFRIGVAPFPAGPVRRTTLATTDGFGIYKRTAHPEAAWDLLQFLTGEAYGLAMAEANFLQPARKSLVEDWVAFIRQGYPEKAADIDIAAFADGQIKGYSVTAEIATDMAEVVSATNAAWDRIFTLGEAPVDLMIQVCRDLNG